MKLCVFVLAAVAQYKEVEIDDVLLLQKAGDVKLGARQTLLQQVVRAEQLDDLPSLSKKFSSLLEPMLAPTNSPTEALLQRASFDQEAREMTREFVQLPAESKSKLIEATLTSSDLSRFFLAFPDQYKQTFLAQVKTTHTRGLEQAVADKKVDTDCGEGTSCIRVQVLWVRHGHACHNAMAHQGGRVFDNKKNEGGIRLGILAMPFYRDPYLTNCGKLTSERNGRQLREALDGLNWSPERIFTSPALRTMDTATIMFPNETVYPIPFIGEKGFGLIAGNCNTPRKIEEQKQVLQNKSVDFSYLPTSRVELKDKRVRFHRYTAKRSKIASSNTAFRAHFGEQVLPKLLEQRGDNSEPLRFVMVGHAVALRVMTRDYFHCRSSKLGNNEALFVDYDYNPKTQRMFEVLDDNSCIPPFEGEVSSGWHETYLCKKDYDNCFDHGGRKSMGVNSKNESKFVEDAEPGQMCCVDQPDGLH